MRGDGLNHFYRIYNNEPSPVDSDAGRLTYPDGSPIQYDSLGLPLDPPNANIHDPFAADIRTGFGDTLSPAAQEVVDNTTLVEKHFSVPTE